MPRDTDVLRDVQARLLATGAFDAVNRFGPGEWTWPAGDGRVAFVEPERSREEPVFGGHTTLRHLDFKLTILVRDEDPTVRTETLDWLATLAANALNGQPLGGICSPFQTRLTDAQYAPARPPDRRLTIQGRCAYLVEDYDVRDAANPEHF